MIIRPIIRPMIVTRQIAEPLQDIDVQSEPFLLADQDVDDNPGEIKRDR